MNDEKKPVPKSEVTVEKILIVPKLHYSQCNSNKSQRDFPPPSGTCQIDLKINVKNKGPRDFPGGTGDKTPHSQCTGPGFYPWSGN